MTTWLSPVVALKPKRVKLFRTREKGEGKKLGVITTRYDTLVAETY